MFKFESVYFKTSDKKTLIDPDKISRSISKFINKLFGCLFSNLGYSGAKIMRHHNYIHPLFMFMPPSPIDNVEKKFKQSPCVYVTSIILFGGGGGGRGAISLSHAMRPDLKIRHSCVAKLLFLTIIFLWKDKRHNFLFVNNCLTLSSFIVVKDLD